MLITHLDSDHVGSLNSLIYYTYYIKQMVGNVYFPNRDLYDLLKIQGHMEGKDYKFNHIDVDKNTFSEFGNIRPIEVEHIETLNCLVIYYI